MRCPDCGGQLDEDNYCSECLKFIDNPINDTCPNCGNELDEDNYCSQCYEFFNDEEDSNFYGYDEPDYNSMVNNGENICLNCTFWSVSPYGGAHGMVCRKGQLSNGPDDSCGLFVQERHFANYGDEGQFQFDETGRAIKNKLNYWENNRF